MAVLVKGLTGEAKVTGRKGRKKVWREKCCKVATRRKGKVKNIE